MVLCHFVVSFFLPFFSKPTKQYSIQQVDMMKYSWLSKEAAHKKLNQNFGCSSD